MTKTTRPARRGRRTVARHGELSSPHPLSLLLKVLGVIVAVVLASGAGIAAYAAYDITASFAEGAVDLEGQGPVPPDIGAIESEVDLFIAGTDACEPEYAQFFGSRCTGADAGGELNDVNLLVHISAEPRRVTVVSFPRDLMLPIPSCTRADGSQTSAMSKQMINSAYMYGGLSCVVKTVSQLAGRPIPFAAKVTWGGVIEITNAIGGVEVCIGNGGIRDRYTGIDWPAGPRTISGLEALQFLRTRHGLENGSDLARISNQQQYMSRLAKKIMSEDVLSDLPTLLKLATTAVDNITPSESLTNPVTLMQIALAVKNVPFEDIVFVQYPVKGDPSDPNRVVPDYEAAEALWAAIDANVPVSLTADPNRGGGVIVVDPQPSDQPTTAPVEPTPGSTEPATPSPTPVELPSSISGVTADQETCSAGNLRANR
ncbi:LCP family protein [Microbacterium immunditiarum]|uniref:LCP family protein required for cell wall assembly n=1 Tax=Microbacterium immunditiarum TaxID=337480 RepID=A0A7Y9GP36_9MICO|nr:LCP family protein required for cell wall assembly [Microbacterium immunditiarum]